MRVTKTDAMAVPLKIWDEGVPMEPATIEQLQRICQLPFVFKHGALMPDGHVGKGATVGSVIATKGAVIPAAVGVDIGCGMVAARTTLMASDLPDSLSAMRSAIEAAVPHGRTANGGSGDRGAWGNIPDRVAARWAFLEGRFDRLVAKHPVLDKTNNVNHLGTLGGGNHFIEVCLDLDQNVWVMLHSGSRGVGGRIGSYFIEMAKEDMRKWFINLPDAELAYLPEGTDHFNDYVEAVEWAQDFAAENRRTMLSATLDAMRATLGLDFSGAGSDPIVSCHHNYISRERHFGDDVIVTRKGAVRAREGELGIIPGSMGAKSFIVRGKGNRESFCSCSHGAGRKMSRTEAKRTFSVEDHAAMVKGVECRLDAEVVDETPGAYKEIDAVMAAQGDLVEVVATLKQVLCVKG